MPWWCLFLLFLPTINSLSYKCENNQILVVQSFGNDTIRMHCQRLDLCGYQQLKCEYDKMQPHCGGKTNFVSHVNQNTPTGLVEHTCCQLYNPNPPNHVPTHDGNDCFIYELPDGSTHPQGEVLQPLTPLNAEDKPLTILKSASEIPSQIDGYSGYRLRLFLLRNKSPPTLLVKGIERRIDGYRVTICRPRCGTIPSGWRGVSWNSWSASSWSSWAKTVWGNAEHEEEEKRERVRQREGEPIDKSVTASASAAAAAAAAAAAGAAGGNGANGNTGVTNQSGSSSATASGASSGTSGASSLGQGAQAGASAAAKAESGNSNQPNNGTMHIHIHTDDGSEKKDNGPLVKGFETSGKEKGTEKGDEKKEKTDKPTTATSEEFNGKEKEKTPSNQKGEVGEPAEPIDPTTPNGKDKKDEKEIKQTGNGDVTPKTDEKKNEKKEIGSNGEDKPTIGIDGGEGTESETKNGTRTRIIEGRQGPKEDGNGEKENGGKEDGDDGVTENGEKSTESAEVHGRTETKDFSTEVTETKGDEENGWAENSAGDSDEDGDRGSDDDDDDDGEGDEEPMNPDEDGTSETELNTIIGKTHKQDSNETKNETTEKTNPKEIRNENENEELMEPEITSLNENEGKDDVIEKKKKRLVKAKARAKAKKEAAKRRRKLQAARQEAQRKHNKGQFRTIQATAEKDDIPADPSLEKPAPRLLAEPAVAAAAPAAAAGRNCFAADSIVSTPRGPRRMDELQVGDHVLVPSANGVPKYEMIEMFYHRIPDRRTNFVVLETESGHKLSVTALHLLPFGDCEEMGKLLNQSEGIDMALQGSRFAHRAKIGECILRTAENGEIRAERIVKIGRRISTGIYSPITVEGSIIVDGVLASCFAQVESHSTHKVLYDFTHWVYKTFSLTSTTTTWSEVFPLPRLVHYMHELSRHVLPFSKH
ncbi:unnamed protein product, partial [Mesorhabditis belari]|uniref:Uncharacterized protein n=1 Tax=Mesorhabditis belari TaxID=2138241 RepID=A0AAF3J6Q0_9BILA